VFIEGGENVLTLATRGRGMRAVLLGVVLALAASCLSILLASPKEVEASFPGKNGLIAFSNDLDGDDEIFKMNPDGSNQKQLTHNSTFDWDPVWSPDGTKVAFHRYGKIFVKDTTNGQVVRLTDDSGIRSFNPTWSPDGTKIAFSSTRSGGYAEIYTMNSADGSELQKLTNNPLGGGSQGDGWPTWSPDGTKIAFTSALSTHEIYVMNADGTNQRPLSNTLDQNELDPDWSPDGTRIAYERDNDIWVMKADGTGQVNVTNSPEVSEHGPAWSPNGRKIVYSVSVESSSSNVHDIWIMNADGTNAKNVTNTPGTSEFLPSWQPVLTP